MPNYFPDDGGISRGAPCSLMNAVSSMSVVLIGCRSLPEPLRTGRSPSVPSGTYALLLASSLPSRPLLRPECTLIVGLHKMAFYLSVPTATPYWIHILMLFSSPLPPQLVTGRNNFDRNYRHTQLENDWTNLRVTEFQPPCSIFFFNVV